MERVVGPHRLSARGMSKDGDEIRCCSFIFS